MGIVVESIADTNEALITRTAPSGGGDGARCELAFANGEFMHFIFLFISHSRRPPDGHRAQSSGEERGGERRRRRFGDDRCRLSVRRRRRRRRRLVDGHGLCRRSLSTIRPCP